MQAQSYTFTIDNTEIVVGLNELAIIAAFRKANPAPLILGCTACVSLCVDRHRPCTCCTQIPSDRHFNSATYGSQNPGAHRMIPKAQLAEALALVRAA